MKFKHRDGADAAARISLGPVRDKADVDDDGTFDVDADRDDFDDVVERLTAAGHEPVDDADDQDVDEAGQTEAEIPPASAYDEQTIVEELAYNEKQAIASQYDHIAGNASDDELTEALIEQRRDEVDESDA